MIIHEHLKVNIRTTAVIAICAAALVFFGYHLCRGIVADLLYHQSKAMSGSGKYGLALNRLKLAQKHLPHESGIQKELGAVYLKLSGFTVNGNKSYTLAEKANHHLNIAMALNPMDSEIHYILGLVEQRLIELRSLIYPAKAGPGFHPEKRLERAMELYPNSMHARRALIRLLHKKNRKAEYLKQIRTLLKTHPQSYPILKREPFWTMEAKSSALDGLLEAVSEKIQPRSAHFAISSIMADRKNWTAAIDHYRRALNHHDIQNNSDDYLYLGGLYLKMTDFGNAESCFTHAMRLTRDQDKCLDKIYQMFKSEHILKKPVNPDQIMKRIRSVSGF